MGPVWSDVRSRDPEEARSKSVVLALAMAPGRGVREDQRRDVLSVASGRSRRRGSGSFCNETPKSQGRASISEEGHETIRPTEDHSDRSPGFISVSHEIDWQCFISGVPTLAQQSRRKFTSTVSNTRARDGEVPEFSNSAEVCLGSRLNPQSLQPATPPDDTRRIQAKPTLALAEWRQLAA